MNVLLGITGSVASKLSEKFRNELLDEAHCVSIVTTECAKEFKLADTWHYDDPTEWEVYKNTNTVLHIDLTKWADAFIVAPCSANTLGKIANGICDNLLTSCVRAWDLQKKLIVAPAMNTNMYNHPITSIHLDLLKSWGITIVEPQNKTLFCGDTGVGAMAEINDIITHLTN